MAEILLQELSNADIDWMVTTGLQERIVAGTVLLRPGEPADALYLLLDGVLALLAPEDEGCMPREIAALSRGEVVGVATALDTNPIFSSVLAQQQLSAKLKQDRSFAVHFYRAIALILSVRLRRMYENPEKLGFEDDQSPQDALAVFGELQDSDIDWLISAGRVEKLQPNQILMHAGRPVDALHIILDGLFSISVPEGHYDSLSLCFQGLERSTRSQQTISSLSKGALPGIVSFLDSQPLPVTIRAAQESLVFIVPRPQLLAKLQQDLGFASRFYRVIALEVLDLLRSVMNRLGCGQRQYTHQQGMDAEMEYEDELDLDELHQMSQGANRFTWMLKRLGVGSTRM
jgi:bacteriocin-type transport-associated protein